MSNIEERLDKVRELIQEPEFLEGKGLSNEVNIRIFCYDPEDEMAVRHFTQQLETDHSLSCRLRICNLYQTFLSICEDIGCDSGYGSGGRKYLPFGTAPLRYWRR